MITVNIRKQGGAAVITIPSDVLKILNLDVGSTLSLDITSKGFMARPLPPENRKRYSLAELLQGTTPEARRNWQEEQPGLEKANR